MARNVWRHLLGKNPRRRRRKARRKRIRSPFAVGAKVHLHGRRHFVSKAELRRAHALARRIIRRQRRRRRQR